MYQDKIMPYQSALKLTAHSPEVIFKRINKILI